MNGLDAGAVQEQIAVVTPQVGRLQGWLQIAAGRLDELTGGSVHDPDSGSVTPARRRNLAARDLGCTARGCTRPPAMCDAHHLRRRADGGETTMDDLVLLCRRHHVPWHLGKIDLHDLNVPWHPDQQPGAPPPDPLDALFGRRG